MRRHLPICRPDFSLALQVAQMEKQVPTSGVVFLDTLVELSEHLDACR